MHFNSKQRATDKSGPFGSIPKEFPSIEPNELKLLDAYVNEWITIIKTQMHFNDLIIRFRSVSLTVLFALIGGLASISKIIPSVEFSWIFLVALPLGFWIASFVLDFFYYHRLLLGAVAEARKFDESSVHERFGLFGMTACIKNYVQPPTSKILIIIFYSSPITIAIIAGILYCLISTK